MYADDTEERKRKRESETPCAQVRLEYGDYLLKVHLLLLLSAAAAAAAKSILPEAYTRSLLYAQYTNFLSSYIY